MILRLLRAFGRFWFDFVVGDDWRPAVGICLLVVVGGWLVHGRVVPFGVIEIGVPVIVIVLVAASILSDARRMRSD